MILRYRKNPVTSQLRLLSSCRLTQMSLPETKQNKKTAQAATQHQVYQGPGVMLAKAADWTQPREVETRTPSLAPHIS